LYLCAKNKKEDMELRNTFQSIIALHQREFPLDLQAREMQLPLDGGRIVTVTGIRRCGKSSLLGLTINRLLESGVPKERILYVGFIGLKDFSWSFNGALIKSKVQFEKGSKEENRPMQGQSPYLINTGIFYKNEPLKMDIALLYNRIGKRIIGVGRSEGSTGDDSNSRVPHSYEMPRNTIDFSLAKKFGNHLELKLNVRDLLAEKIYYKQFADVTYSDGSKKEVEEIARCYKPGRNIGLQAIYKF
jgi:hypothetical protein